MRYTRLGTSALSVSALTLGGNIFGHFCDEQETIKIINHALDAGINCIDTADVYSDGRSEEFIGKAIRGKREKVMIATKIGIRPNESPVGKFCADDIFRAIDKSLLRLQTDYVDLYQLHAPDSVTPLEETVGAMDTLLRQGKIRAFGLSNYQADEVLAACEACDRQKLARPSSLQIWWNVLDRKTAQGVLSTCQKENIAIMPYGVLARGLLTGKYKPGSSFPAGTRAAIGSERLKDDMSVERLKKAQRLDNYARSKGYSGAGLACAWLLSQPQAATCIVGVRSTEQLNENAAGAAWTLTAEQVSEIDSIANTDQNVCPVIQPRPVPKAFGTNG